jgi:hypothetical protein
MFSKTPSILSLTPVAVETRQALPSTSSPSILGPQDRLGDASDMLLPLTSHLQLPSGSCNSNCDAMSMPTTSLNISWDCGVV